MPLSDRIARFLFPRALDRAAVNHTVARASSPPDRNSTVARASSPRSSAAPVTVRVDDAAGWDTLTPGPLDRPWSERKADLDDALEAWRKSFLVRRIVTLIRSYVIGDGITVSSARPEVDAFVQAFWTHRQNRMGERLGPWCDELTRCGEVFPVLYTNRVDGMSYVRMVPATEIREIETGADDYEVELRYGQLDLTGQLKWYYGPGHRYAYRPTRGGRLRPLMLHYAVNRPVGATRGEGDLGPILPWALRYSEWLKDRVRLNRIRTRQGILDIEIADDTMVESKRQQLRRTNPMEHGIYVHGPGETSKLHALSIGGGDAGPDGQVLRMAVATGANVALHYIGEGETVNYATAKEMGEPTSRFFAERQAAIRRQAVDLVAVAYRRKVALGLAPPVDDLELRASVTEPARADNLTLAQAARNVAAALAVLSDHGWIDDRTAARIVLQFAGETVTEAELSEMLARAAPGA